MDSANVTVAGSAKMVVIRLPKISDERRRAYLRAAGREKKSLADFILDAADRAALDEAAKVGDFES